MVDKKKANQWSYICIDFVSTNTLENVKSPGRHVGAAVTKSSFSYLVTHLHILHLSPTVHPQQPTSLVTSDTLLY